MEPLAQVAQVGWGAGLAALGAGVLSFFSPCVAPLVPGYIGFLSGRAMLAGDAGAAAESRQAGMLARAALPVCLLFISGFSAAFVALGLALAGFGRLIAAYQPVLETVAGIVMLVMGLFLLNLLPRGVTAVLLRERRLHFSGARLARPGGAGPFLLGVVFAAGWTPCIGPVLGAILAYVAASGDTSLGFWLLSLYAVGFAAPFLAVGLGWSAGLGTLGWARRHGRAISTATGVALLLMSILYLTGQVSIFATWAQQLAVSAPR